jgi:hypothetical protein
MVTVRKIRFTCRVHGLLHEAEVECRHDAEGETRRVVEAHRAGYGAGCAAAVTAEMLDEDGKPEGGRTQHLTVAP